MGLRRLPGEDAAKFEITSKRVMTSYGVAWRYGSERFRARGATEVRGRAADIRFRLLATEF
jgi:hypothetical protein